MKQGIKKLSSYLSKHSYILLELVMTIDFWSRLEGHSLANLLYLGIFGWVLINNHLRWKYLGGNKYYWSIFLSLVLANFLSYQIGGFIDIMNFMIIFELVLYGDGKSMHYLLLTSLLAIIFPVIRSISLADLTTARDWLTLAVELIFLLSYLVFFLGSLFSYKTIKKQRNQVQALNEDLEKSYEKLLDQSKEIERLTISRERNRLAGEMHDALGHDLIALNMNLEVADKVWDKDPGQARFLLGQSKKLAEASMANLRKAVYALEEEPAPLNQRLEKLMDNLRASGQVELFFEADPQLEALSQEKKNIIYQSVQEALTNSIKHGQAKKIEIDFDWGQEELLVRIRDHGLGSPFFIKGQGLKAMEARLASLGGRVHYQSREDQGFLVELLLPLAEQASG